MVSALSVFICTYIYIYIYNSTEASGSIQTYSHFTHFIMTEIYFLKNEIEILVFSKGH